MATRQDDITTGLSAEERRRRDDDDVSSGKVRIVAISDTHQLTDHLEIPPGDILIHAGDFLERGDPAGTFHFCQFLRSLPHPVKIIVPGNHDVPFLLNHDASSGTAGPTLASHQQQIDMLLAVPGVVLLRNEFLQLDSLTIYGYPWQPLGHRLPDLADGPTSPIDVLISHAPAWGIGDEGADGILWGESSIGELVSRLRPRLHIFGHVHCAYGIHPREETIHYNVAMVSRDRQTPRPAHIIDISPSTLPS